MANEKVRFKTGSKENINNITKSAGTVYFATETNDNVTDGYIYFDKDNSTRVLMGRKAEIAEYDSNGHIIANTYVASVVYDGTTSPTQYVIANFRNGANQLSTVNFPAAGSSSAGVITTGTQTIAGAKTLTGALTSSGGATFSNVNFNYSGIESATANATRAVWFADSSKVGKPVYNNNFTYNPSTNTLTVANLSGTATKAISDGRDQNIADNYIKSISADGSTLTITKGNNTSTTQTISSMTIRRWT